MKKIKICYSISCLLLLLLLSTFINKPLIENAYVETLNCYTIGGQNGADCESYTDTLIKNFSEKQSEDVDVNGSNKEDLINNGIIAETGMG